MLNRTVMTRRRRAGVFVALLAAAAMALAGCGGDSDSGSSGQSGSGEVDTNATLRATFPTMPGTFDPHTTESEQQLLLFISLVYERLTQMVHADGGPQLAPMLAKSWEFSSDGKEVTFHLRDDSTFADGTKVDASAVKLSLERAITLPESSAKRYFAAISSVEAPDPTTVVIKTTEPSADLPYLLSSAYGSIINPKALNNDDLDVNMQGSGPYTAEVKVGDSVTYTRRDDPYWDKDAGKPKSVVVSVIPDPNTRLSSLQSGQSDFTLITQNQRHAAEQVAKNAKFALTIYKHPGTTVKASINQYRPYMDDPRVRQAFNFAVDKQGINDSILNDAGAPISQFLAPGAEGYREDLEDLYTLDPEKARSLLEESGVPDGYQINIMAANYSPAQDAAQAVQAQLEAIGLKVKLDLMDIPTVFTTWNKDSKYDIQVTQVSGNETSRMTLFNQYLTYRALLNPTPPEFVAELAKAADPNTSEADRKAALEAANGMTAEQAWDIFINKAPTTILGTASLTGVDSMGRADYQGIFDLRYVGVNK